MSAGPSGPSPVPPPTPSSSRSSRIMVVVEEFHLNFDVELGLEEGENSKVVSQCLRAVRTANPLQLERICGVVSATR